MKDENISARDQFIIDRYQEGIRPDSILILLEQNGFRKPARSRIYQILEKHGVPLRSKKADEKK